MAAGFTKSAARAHTRGLGLEQREFGRTASPAEDVPTMAAVVLACVARESLPAKLAVVNLNVSQHLTDMSAC
eukprot:SAG11_NODE_5972_length_1422_cov_1.489040_2_plen_72_part_00